MTRSRFFPGPTRAPLPDEDQRVVLHDVPWAAYVTLRDAVDFGGVRMTYLRGDLEIARTSRAHEVAKTQIARLLELSCLERDIPLFGYGSTTFRKEEKERGLEPDECYCRGADREVPDLAIEVVRSRGSIDKLDVYRGLGIGEVWVFEKAAFRVFVLRDDGYQPVASSLDVLADFASRSDQHAALRASRDVLRTP